MPTINTQMRNAIVTAIINQIDSGASNAKLLLKNDANQIIVEVNLAKPSFGTPANGTSFLLAVPIQGTVILDGTITKYEILNGVGTKVIEGTAGTTLTEILLSSAQVTVGDIININALALNAPSE